MWGLGTAFFQSAFFSKKFGAFRFLKNGLGRFWMCQWGDYSCDVHIVFWTNWIIPRFWELSTNYPEILGRGWNRCNTTTLKIIYIFWTTKFRLIQGINPRICWRSWQSVRRISHWWSRHRQRCHSGSWMQTFFYGRCENSCAQKI